MTHNVSSQSEVATLKQQGASSRPTQNEYELVQFLKICSDTVIQVIFHPVVTKSHPQGNGNIQKLPSTLQNRNSNTNLVLPKKVFSRRAGR